MTVRILVGDCRDVLRALPAGSVHACGTSPPYWGLRDYQIEPSVWGGDPDCAHEWGLEVSRIEKRVENKGLADTGWGKPEGRLPGLVEYGSVSASQGSFCRCGAWRGAFGLEPTPELFIAHAVEVFREVHRVLRDDGTLWINIGDSYAASGRGGNPTEETSTLEGGQSSQRASMVKRARHPDEVGATARDAALTNVGRRLTLANGKPTRFAENADADGRIHTSGVRPPSGLKPKDLVGIPWMLAFALRADGWWLRQEIIWCLSGGNWIYARTAAGAGPVMLKDLVRLKPETVELWTGERWTRVVAWTKRQGRADAVELVLRSGERIGCTSNHVWPTQRGNIATAELNVGDVIQTSRLPTGGQGTGWITPEAFWFAGLYLAEGSRSGETMQISGHVKETARLDRIRALVDHYGGSARPYQKGNAQNIHIDSTGLAAVVRTLIAGHTAKDKHLTMAAWQYRDWALGHIAAGYLEGDGHQEDARIRLGFCRNYALERDLRCLGARLGATVIIKPSVAKNQTGSFPAFKGEWRWSRSGHHNERDVGEVVEIRRSRARKFWDVTVADHPHLFALASGVLTHNSKPNPMPESVEDRCTKAHEQLFLLAKSEQYFFDADAIAEPANYAPDCGWDERGKGYFDGKRGDADNVEKEQAFRAIRETRNKRSVWTISTKPYPEAHFATFPPDLIEPCIKASTSERGCCPACGAGWARVIRPSDRYAAFLGESYHDHANDLMAGMMQHRGVNRQNIMREEAGLVGRETELLGWYPHCRCDELPSLPKHPKRPARDPGPSEHVFAWRCREWLTACRLVDDRRKALCDAAAPTRTVPAVFLDPFGGSGTSALVADRLQRDSIIVEINPKYAEMARRRIYGDAPLFHAPPAVAAE